MLAPRDSRLLMLQAEAFEKQKKYQEVITTLNQARSLLTPVDPNWSRINSKIAEMKDKVSDNRSR